VSQFSHSVQPWIILLLVWLGVGILAGLAAKILIPGREPVGAIGTLLVGSLGSVVGPLLASLAFNGLTVNPIDPLGLLASVGGAVLTLIAYRLLIHSLVVDGEAEKDGE
jgi:uncharacterized membrane protein YeaQ/YmgE (transglycosylase-associated protein family)